MRSILMALALSAALTPRVFAADQRHFDDAPLHAVQFVDANEGWAVGDEGVIWHSIDGGKNWERQPTGVLASFRAVHFLNPFTGWVAGREELPQGGSLGVLLVTRDGGLKWQRVGTNALPGLNCVHFFDDKTGLVAGDGSDQYPTGVLTTSDGGRTWKALPGPRCPGWLGGDFTDPQTGALAGAWSRLATLRKGVLGAADVDTLGGRSVHGLQLMGKQAVAVGEGGLVLVSTNSAGLRWGYADLKLPTETLACLDFHAVHARREDVWVAGKPGSVVLHSPDRGVTWEVQKTGQSVPLHGIWFQDEQHGWAVGELGCVLMTENGGKSWTVQRQGGQRAAVLFIHARPAGLPLETVALLGGEEGLLAAAVRVVTPDPASTTPSRASDGQRWAAAMRQAGGAGGEMLWHFPVPQHLKEADQHGFLAAWDRLHADRAAEQLLRQLVLAIRTWQPDVIITDYVEPKTADTQVSRPPSALEELVFEATKEAFKRAADPKAFPEQLEQLGLKPCTVSKLYGRCADRKAAQVVLDLTADQLRLQSTLRDFAAAPAHLLAEAPVRLPMLTPYRLLATRIEGATSHRDLMQGIPLASGGTARRKLEPLPDMDPDAKKALLAQRQLLALTEAPSGGLTEPNKLLALIGPTLKDLPADQGAPAAFAIASQFARAGQWIMARETYLLMVNRYPAHPLSVEAYRWLIRYNCSSEARRRQELGQFLLRTQIEIQGVKSPDQIAPGETQNRAEIRSQEEMAPLQARAKNPAQRTELVQQALKDLAEARTWYKGALEVETRLAAFGPLFGNDPAVQFCLQAARRNLGEFDAARKWYIRFLADHPEGPWHDAAAAELWLINRQGPPPKPVAICRRAGAAPFLDGAFDDDCWQGMKPLKFRNAVGKTLKEKSPGVVDEAAEQEYDTQAWLAYDNEFLYLALRCRHPAEKHVAPVKVRKRDADLRDYDRVSLMLDLDRDYNTYFQLQVDQRGCICDDCWGDLTWNPRWFVAVRSEETCWQIEAAIPLAELTGEPITAGRVWACNLVRILPGRGVQAWSVPADVEPRPEGMGLLHFMQDKEQAAPLVGPSPRTPPAPATAEGRQ